MGTVGTGVARLLVEQQQRVAQRAGCRVELARVVVRDRTRPREVLLPAGVVTDDLSAVTQDREIRVVAHLVGGLEPARSIMLRLLEAGKDVVTANKALLAEHGPELFDRARELGRSIAFDAAVAGGIPIVTNIAQCLAANQILSLHGILNGTSNFILTQMEEQQTAYEEALREAQRRGYAEADPSLDVNGTDAAQKLAILAQLAFGARVPWQQVAREGIDQVTLADIRFAHELGYRIRLIAQGRLSASGLELRVAPMLVRMGGPMADVRDAYNAISVVGDAVGRIFYHGLGAGQMPTASAVVADMIDMVVGRMPITFRTLKLWDQPDGAQALCPPEHQYRRFYMRLDVVDRPGVLAEIAGVLGRHTISIASVIQHEQQGDGPVVPLVIMTHRASERNMERALVEIRRLAVVQSPGVCLRVLE
ncbi:MAG: homoserine dehydrogenase [Pirellulaceae bacterium]|nr:MAG: homoserine dehydrogenase [Pirellulaceae bacterium]